MTNLERLTGAERLALCRKYFFIGLAFTPLVWLVNCVWFYRFAFCKHQDDADEETEVKPMRKYLVMSAVGNRRLVGGHRRVAITFIIPMGRV
ncbi:Gamma-secretase subunit PEN-2 [Aphelenchoides fujianensis]|nr:Gamma-secretase subunit PEN-2 [Aphelenchoides fujianensis]